MAQTAAPRKTLLIAVDIEKAGARKHHPVVSVGIVAGDTEGQVILKTRVNFAVSWPKTYPSELGAIALVKDYGDFEPRCWDEFWSCKIPPSAIEECKANALELHVGWQEVHELIVSTCNLCKGHKVVYLSNNPSFDIAAIDDGFDHIKQLPLKYTPDGKYHGDFNPNNMLFMLAPDVQHSCREEVERVVVHDHNPANDAHSIYLTYLQCLKQKAV